MKTEEIKKISRELEKEYQIASLYAREAVAAITGAAHRAVEKREKSAVHIPDSNFCRDNATLSSSKVYDLKGGFPGASPDSPAYAVNYYNLGILYARDLRWARAIKYFKKAIVLEPRFGDAIYNLAYCYEKSGDLDQAIVTWNKYLHFVSEPISCRELSEHIADLTRRKKNS